MGAGNSWIDRTFQNNMMMLTRYTHDNKGEMVQVATDRQGLASGVEIYVNIARMLFEALEGEVFRCYYHVCF